MRPTQVKELPARELYLRGLTLDPSQLCFKVLTFPASTGTGSLEVLDVTLDRMSPPLWPRSVLSVNPTPLLLDFTMIHPHLGL